MMMIWLVTGSAVLLAFFVAAAVLRYVQRDKLTAEQRLLKLNGDKALPAQQRERLREQRKSRIKVSAALRDQLASAGVPMRGEEFLVAWLLMTLGPAGLLALTRAHLLVCVTVMGLGFMALPLYVRRSRQKRLIAIEKQLPDAISSISNCIKSGLTFQQGMQTVSEQLPEPISREFGRVLREMQLGSSTERALNNLARRVPSADVRLMVTAILISQQVGGSLSAVLDNIAVTVSDRLQIKSDIRTITSTGRISGMIIGLLPVFIAVVLMLINPGYMQQFFTQQTGRIMLLVAAGMEGVGYMIINKIVSVKY